MFGPAIVLILSILMIVPLVACQSPLAANARERFLELFFKIFLPVFFALFFVAEGVLGFAVCRTRVELISLRECSSMTGWRSCMSKRCPAERMWSLML